MHIAVCIKQVLDPEAPARAFRLDPSGRRVAPGDTPLVMGPYDENALESGLQLKEKTGAKLTALSFGSESSEEILKKALAVTADDAVLVTDPALASRLAEGDIDPQAAARALARAIQRLDGVDVVLVGRQGGDWDAGAMAQLLAEELDFGCVSLGTRLEPADGGALRILAETGDGYDVIEARPPVVVSVTNDGRNALRLAKVRDLMMANRKKINRFSLADLGLSPDDLAPKVTVERLALPEARTKVEMIEGQNGADKAARLAARLRELKLL